MGVKEMDRPSAVEEASQSTSSSESLMCGPEPESHEQNQSVGPVGPAGPAGPVDHGASSSAFDHYTDVPTHSEFPPIKLMPPAKKDVPRLDLTKNPPAKSGPKPPKTPPKPKGPSSKPLTHQEELDMMPKELRGAMGKSPEEQAKVMSEYKKSQFLDRDQQKATKGMTFDDAVKHLEEQEKIKLLPEHLRKDWANLSPQQRKSALDAHEAKLRAASPAPAPK